MFGAVNMVIGVIDHVGIIVESSSTIIDSTKTCMVVLLGYLVIFGLFGSCTSYDNVMLQ